MAESVEAIPGGMDKQRKAYALEQRRCILLAIVGSTPPSNAPLKRILSDGFLTEVKSWLDDILNNLIGGVDLLLHLLTNISNLPVTKEMVTSSKLGKAVAAVEKHKICVGGGNEKVIKERVAKVKENWSASVKRMKNQTEEKGGGVKAGTPPSAKRGLDAVNAANSASVKKAKTEEHAIKKGSSLSSLIKKVSTTGNGASSSGTAAAKLGSDKGGNVSSAAEDSLLRMKPSDSKLKTPVTSVDPPSADTGEGSRAASYSNQVTDQEERSADKSEKHIKWADTTGGTLAQEVEGGEDDKQMTGQEENHDKMAGGISWSDRRKRDRLREKELLEQARKSKIVDKEDSLDTMAMMIVSWHKPQPLPKDPENPPPQVVSKELATQVSRMAAVLPAKYFSEEEVPDNPVPLSDIEQALDMTSQSSSVATVIPFFAPQQEPTASTIGAVPSPTISVKPPPVAAAVLPPPSQPSLQPSTGASVELVQAMGLPLFLVGCNAQALQTLASSPSLLNTFVDANGMYDQPRLLNLVNTLTQNLTPAQPVQPVPQMGLGGSGFQAHAPPPPPPPQYGVSQPSPYQAVPQSSGHGRSKKGPEGRKGYRGDQNLSEGNLHISGYGPSTTQAEIIAMFSPYVKIEEVVQKSGFSFVNTRDPAGARRAKEALNGALLGGSPVRINIAQRRNNKDSSQVEIKSKSSRAPPRSEAVPLPRNVLGQIEYEKVRDDRGNPATKNLFVAGYGNGTSEETLRQIFGQHATVTGVIMKGTFCFVNTSDKMAAVHAREALTGSVINGGVLRINFAKETGRLGTSFDTTYGPASNSRYMRNAVH